MHEVWDSLYLALRVYARQGGSAFGEEDACVSAFEVVRMLYFGGGHIGASRCEIKLYVVECGAAIPC